MWHEGYFDIFSCYLEVGRDRSGQQGYDFFRTYTAIIPYLWPWPMFVDHWEVRPWKFFQSFFPLTHLTHWLQSPTVLSNTFSPHLLSSSASVVSCAPLPTWTGPHASVAIMTMTFTVTMPSAMWEVIKWAHNNIAKNVARALSPVLAPAQASYLYPNIPMAVKPLFHHYLDPTAQPFDISCSLNPIYCHYCPYTTIGVDINITRPPPIHDLPTWRYSQHSHCQCR